MRSSLGQAPELVIAEAQRTLPSGTLGADHGIVTGAGAPADALASMIEQENQKLREKNDKVKKQLEDKAKYVKAETERYQAKIRKLKEQRDALMDRNLPRLMAK